jgi:hypothetical protein
MARNEAVLREAAKASGTSLQRAFEKSINAVFTVLGKGKAESRMVKP